MTLPLQLSTRTHSISEIRSTLLSDEHQEALADQEVPVDREAQTTPTEGQTTQEQYPLLISFPSTPQEISNLPEYPLSYSMVTGRAPTPSSENYEYT